VKQYRTVTLLTVALLIGSTPVAVAQHTATSATVPGRERPVVTVRSDELLARDWGLSAEDWARYRELMQGPLGVYSPNLDPLTALGIEARSDEERNRYAELQVQAESRRVNKTLAYQRAYDAAWKRLYPGQLRVNRAGRTGAQRREQGLRPPGRLRQGRLRVVRPARAAVAGGGHSLRCLYGR